MSSTLAEVRQALAAQITDRAGVKAYAFAPAVLVAPCIFPGAHSGTPSTMGGGRDVTLSLWCVLPNGMEETQAKLDEFIEGECSVLAAIDHDRTLGLPDVDTQWVSWGDYGELEWAGVVYFAVKIDVEILIG